MSVRRCDFKIVILGGYNAGKTTLLYRFMKSRYYQDIPNAVAGVFTSSDIERNGCVLRLGIWDTCGQERFRSLVKMYYKDAHAAILCYDITDFSSWKALKCYHEQLRNDNPECKIYICGTKKDIVDFNPNDRQVPLSTVSFYTKGIQAPWFETSAKSGENIDELFNSIVDDCAPLCNEASSGNRSTLTLSQTRTKSRCFCGRN